MDDITRVVDAVRGLFGDKFDVFIESNDAEAEIIIENKKRSNYFLHIHIAKGVLSVQGAFCSKDTTAGSANSIIIDDDLAYYKTVDELIDDLPIQVKRVNLVFFVGHSGQFFFEIKRIVATVEDFKSVIADKMQDYEAQGLSIKAIELYSLSELDEIENVNYILSQTDECITVEDIESFLEYRYNALLRLYYGSDAIYERIQKREDHTNESEKIIEFMVTFEKTFVVSHKSVLPLRLSVKCVKCKLGSLYASMGVYIANAATYIALDHDNIINIKNRVEIIVEQCSSLNRVCNEVMTIFFGDYNIEIDRLRDNFGRLHAELFICRKTVDSKYSMRIYLDPQRLAVEQIFTGDSDLNSIIIDCDSVDDLITTITIKSLEMRIVLYSDRKGEQQKEIIVAYRDTVDQSLKRKLEEYSQYGIYLRKMDVYALFDMPKEVLYGPAAYFL